MSWHCLELSEGSEFLTQPEHLYRHLEIKLGGEIGL